MRKRDVSQVLLLKALIFLVKIHSIKYLLLLLIVASVGMSNGYTQAVKGGKRSSSGSQKSFRNKAPNRNAAPDYSRQARQFGGLQGSSSKGTFRTGYSSSGKKKKVANPSRFDFGESVSFGGSSRSNNMSSKKMYSSSSFKARNKMQRKKSVQTSNVKYGRSANSGRKGSYAYKGQDNNNFAVKSALNLSIFRSKKAKGPGRVHKSNTKRPGSLRINLFKSGGGGR